MKIYSNLILWKESNRNQELWSGTKWVSQAVVYVLLLFKSHLWTKIDGCWRLSQLGIIRTGAYFLRAQVRLEPLYRTFDLRSAQSACSRREVYRYGFNKPLDSAFADADSRHVSERIGGFAIASVLRNTRAVFWNIVPAESSGSHRFSRHSRSMMTDERVDS